METLGIMQPYIFPYIGYFQLIKAVDKFVVYDDVTFIKQGWINRNNILLNNKAYLFTIPLENSSSFTLIKNIKVNPKFYLTWVEKFIKTIEQNYRKAPFYQDIVDLLRDVLFVENYNISELAFKSIAAVTKYLDINTEFVATSSIYDNAHLKSQARVIDICLKECARNYINPVGGKELYCKNDFKEKGLNLSFIKPKTIAYKQFNKDEFVPWLSIIDVMMFNEVSAIHEMLNQYEFV